MEDPKEKQQALEAAKKIIETEMQDRVKEFGEELDKLEKRLRCSLAIVVPSKNSKIPIDQILKLPVVLEIVAQP